MVLYGVVWYDVVWQGMVWYGMVCMVWHCNVNYDLFLFPDLSLSGDHNSIWFFEKETSKLKVNTPVWEGTIVEFKHTVKVA